MVNSGTAVGCRWTFVKSIMGSAFSHLNALVENPFVLPEAKDALLELGKVDFSVYFSEHG